MRTIAWKTTTSSFTITNFYKFYNNNNNNNMSFVIPSSYPTIPVHLSRFTSLYLVSRYNSLRFSSSKKMVRDNYGAQKWQERYSKPSDSPVIRSDPVVGDEGLFVGDIQIFPLCKPTIKCRHTRNHNNHEELLSDGNGKDSSSGGSPVKKKKHRIDLGSESRVGDLENLKSRHDGFSLSTVLGKKSFRSYDVNCDAKNITFTNKSVNSEGLLKTEPFDICLEFPSNVAAGSRHSILRPGMVLLKRYLTHREQINIIKVCRDHGLCSTGFYQPRFQSGAIMRLHMMCMGLNWNHESRKYEERRSVDGLHPPSIPTQFTLLVQRAIKDAHGIIAEECRVSNVKRILPEMSPDICIVNFYTTSGRLGLHKDRDESKESLRKGLPVVSFSLGDSAEFLYGDHRDTVEAEKKVLESGDVLIFGGKSRHVFHGVSNIIPNSAPQALLEEACLRPGRLNLTFRQY
ncbi:2OG-FeII_Oxy_2 domain-containing protein [Cephalotus follicularis]|uniref:2OG-FeII_Oxy_2 domain-containing protein n=1 Tax=Cephalotus follicularis TaxID=3775 RepID=A0A1Q3DH82_CEPFO|nr:2OG-FeII_Oxy_2 domain-containing protein [Cephalotus follicularis]